MLIEFSVENFLSIRDKTTLSLERKQEKKGRNHSYLTLFKSIELTPIMAIYGSNGSGKTNLLNAINWAIQIIIDKPISFNMPYAFNKNNDGVSKFQFKFVLNKDLYYVYEISAKRDVSKISIVSEKLYQEVSNNNYNTIYEIDNGKLIKSKISSLSKDNENDIIQPNRPSLYSISRISAEIREIYDFFRTFNFLDGYHSFSEIVRDIAPVLENEEAKEHIIEFLDAADINIKDFKIEKTSDNQISIKTIHIVDGHSYELSLRHESSGTVKLLAILATNFLSSTTPQILVVDELEDNLHPLLCQKLLEAYLNNIDGKSCSQLIFTTHFIELLDRGLLKLDEMAIINKSSATEASTLDRVSSFEEAINSNKNKKIKSLYESGKLGGTPNLQSFTKIIYRHKNTGL